MEGLENKHENQEQQYTDEEVHVKQMNKREIGRLILRFCGNEGCSDDTKTASMRRLLQELIDYFPKEKENVWQDAHITIFDVESNSLVIQSGAGTHKFLVMHGMKNETTITKIKQRQCVIS